MSRFLVLADTQIGVATVSLSDQAEVLERIIEVAIERDVDAVLHGGDVFEGPHVTPEQLRMFIDALEPLRDQEIPLLVIRGNGRHDSAVRKVHALDVFREIGGVIVHDRPDLFHDRPDQFSWGTAVCTLPWVHPGHMLARSDGAAHEGVTEATAQMLVRIAGELAERAGEVPKLLLAHWAISGATLPSGLPVEEIREPVIPWAELDALGYDVIVGAHIHQPQRLDRMGDGLDKTPGIIVGSPQQLNHGEHGDHGCWLLDLPHAGQTGTIIEFIPIPSRRFVTLDATAHGGDGRVETSGGPEDLDGAIVRVRYTASEDQARRIDHSQLRRDLAAAGASRVTIEPTIVREARRRAEGIHEQLDPGEALAAYCDAQGIEEPLRGRMLESLNDWRSR